MSNNHNETIMENILMDVTEMSTGSILRELRPGSTPASYIAESWDEVIAFTNRDAVIDKLVEKRYSEYPDGV